MIQDKGGYWRGLVTGMMLGAGAAVLLTLKRDDETSFDKTSFDDTTPQLMGESGDALSGTLSVAEEAASDLKTEEHDVVESV